MNVNGPDPQQISQVVSAKALQLVRHYYDCLDNPNRRQEWVNFFMPATPDMTHPLLIWNGHQLKTQADIAQYVQNLPPTKHTQSSIDAQPVMGQAENFIVTVEGTVSYAEVHKRRYFQRITASKAPDSDRTFITSDYVRWTAEAS
jgi:hypothetical protein